MIKVLAAWLPCMAVHEYRVVFMLRDPREVFESYKDMLDGTPWTIEHIRQEQLEGRLWLVNRRDVLSLDVVQTEELLRDPLLIFERLAAVGWPIDPVKASQVVDPNKRRVKVHGIGAG